MRQRTSIRSPQTETNPSKRRRLRLRLFHVLLTLMTILVWVRLWNPPNETTTNRTATKQNQKANHNYHNETTTLTPVHEPIHIQGAVLKPQTSTHPPFQIWLFPPSKDIISRKIDAQGLYEKEEIEFTDLVVEIETAKKKETNTNDSVTGTDNIPASTCWAVDIGANIGFHTLHMAANGMNVIAFEPATDTASLLQKSIVANGFDSDPTPTSDSNSNSNEQHQPHRSRVHLVRAAAGESQGVGRLVRHPDSPGMTMLLPNIDDKDSEQTQIQEPLPFGVEKVVGDGIPIVRPEEILHEILPTRTTTTTTTSSKLCLLKVDAEGHELHALKGTNLLRHPFRFLAFEFFPELLRTAGQTDPLDLLLFVADAGYVCATQPSRLVDHQTNNKGNQKKSDGIRMETKDDFRAWYEGHAAPSHKKNIVYHQNLYCQRRTE